MRIKDNPEMVLGTPTMVELATTAVAVPANPMRRSSSAAGQGPDLTRPLSEMRALLDTSREREQPSASRVSSHLLDQSEERIYDNLELCRKHLTLALMRSTRTMLRTRVMADRARERQRVSEASRSRGGARSGALSPLRPGLAPPGCERQASPNERGARTRR
jgi:hypothetical protein